MGCIALVRCVLVLRCGLVGVVWCGIRMQAEADIVPDDDDAIIISKKSNEARVKHQHSNTDLTHKTQHD